MLCSAAALEPLESRLIFPGGGGKILSFGGLVGKAGYESKVRGKSIPGFAATLVQLKGFQRRSFVIFCQTYNLLRNRLIE
jgi:hypothetical protein